MTIRYDIITGDASESVWKTLVLKAFMTGRRPFVNPQLMNEAIATLRTVHCLNLRDAMDTAEEYLAEITEAEFIVD